MPGARNIPAKIGNFVTLPIALPSLLTFPVQATHYLYLSPDEPQVPSPTTSRSIFLSNIPVDTTELHIKLLFSTQLGLPAGRVELVKFPQQAAGQNQQERNVQPKFPQGSKKRKRNAQSPTERLENAPALPSTWDRSLHKAGSIAIVVFIDRASMEAALKATKGVLRSNTYPVWGEGIEHKLPPLGSASESIYNLESALCSRQANTGYSGYKKHQELMYPDKEELLDSVNDYMTAYAAQENEQVKIRAQQRQEPDEDGFVTVTKGGRSNPSSFEAARAVAQKQKQRRPGFDDFYRFQGREKRKERAKELLRKFEEDKERIRQLKQSRSFQVATLVSRAQLYTDTPKPE